MDGLPAFDATQPIAPLEAPAPTQGQPQSPDALPSFDATNPVGEDKYSTPTQTALAGAEGLAKGILGPIPAAVEKFVGVPAEDIRGREEAHPYIHGGAEATGFVGSMLTGVGEAALLGHAGEAAAKAVGLAAPVSYAARVGSAAVRQAAEMAVLQSGNEIHKNILNDPQSSSESAIANIGLAAAIGGAGGAFLTGAVSPIWSATVGPKVEEFLGAVKGHLDGGAGLQMPEHLQTAFKDLGIEPPPVMKAAMAGDPKAIQLFNELREAQHPEITAHLKSLPDQVEQAVTQHLGIPLEEMGHYSDNTAGHQLFETFKKEYDSKYAPIAEAMEKRNAEAAGIKIPDDAKRDFSGRVIQKGISELGADSPFYKTYEHYADRILAKDSIGALDKLKTEIGNSAKSITSDFNQKNALNDVRKMISEFQESQIESQGTRIAENGAKSADEILNSRKAANKSYSDFANMSEELTDHLGAGKFRGAGTLKSKLEGIEPEALLKKFSPKGNTDSIEFLAKHFPDTLKEVQANETKKFLSPSVYTEGGKSSIDVNKLSKAIASANKGSPEYAKFALPPGTQEKLQAAKAIMDAVPAIKSSGTAGWISKLTKHVPASAISAIGYLMGHNPISGYMLGELAQRLGKDVPEAMKLSYLKFLASEAPVKAEAFMGMVDMVQHSVKGQTMMNNAVANVFKGGAQVLSSGQMSSVANREKLDKIIEGSQTNEKLMAGLSNGHVGHYLPDHQTALAANAAGQIQYLASLRPKPTQNSPLDRPIDSTPAQKARYNRALDIANNPTTVLQHVKDGTVQISDLQDLKSLYPSLYPQIAQKLSDSMIHRHADSEHIPYKTRIGLSLFLAQPIDSTMTPQAILAAQPKPVQGQPPQAPMKGKQGKSAINKASNQYRTPSQAAEKDRGDRD